MGGGVLTDDVLQGFPAHTSSEQLLECRCRRRRGGRGGRELLCSLAQPPELVCRGLFSEMGDEKSGQSTDLGAH